jgi:hypothetical protein
MRNRMTTGKVRRYDDEHEKGKGIMKGGRVACVA